MSNRFWARVQKPQHGVIFGIPITLKNGERGDVVSMIRVHLKKKTLSY